MMKPTAAHITFDTNVCNVVHAPDKRFDDCSPDDARRIRVILLLDTLTP